MSSLSSRELSNLVGNSIGNIFRMLLINPMRYLDANGQNNFDFKTALEGALTSSTTDAAFGALNQLIKIRGVRGISNDALSNLVQGAIASVVSESVRLETGKFVKFNLNPKTLDVSHQKVTNEVFTEEGKILEMYSNDLSTYTFSGSSGTLLPDPVFLSLGIRHPKLSRAWLKFIALEKFYLAHKDELLIIVFEYKGYLGKIIRLHYRIDADNPWQIIYDFTVRLDPTLSFDIITGAGISGVFSKIDLTQLFNIANQKSLFTSSDIKKIGTLASSTISDAVSKFNDFSDIVDAIGTGAGN